MRHLFIAILLGIAVVVHPGWSNLCSEEFCQSYLEKETCIELPEACTIQNSSHNGIYLPSPGPCNCCKYCLENLEKDEKCAIGDPSSPTPTTICGDGLTCTTIDDASTCQTMDTACIAEQLLFDENVRKGEIGHLEIRQHCDRNGLYEPYKCVPGEICYCVSEDGKRIFGEIPFTPIPQFSLRCKCSRSYDKATTIENRQLNPLEHFRCQPNGDYDTIQCMDDKCFCVDVDNGHLTYPELMPVNVTMISQTTLLCFDNKTHQEAEYYRICEDLYAQILNKTNNYKDDYEILFGYILPNCQLDGYYAPVQATTASKYCSDRLGNRLENFEVLKSDPLSLTMDCKCARARSVMTDVEKPECCKNGNYKKIQNRRGLCRCVDENGVQVEKEVDCQKMDELSCFDSICI